ncbi:DUF2158 domain-containing protein [Bartonella sp. HY329]|uniref:YodC family protein n=1 Tax=unclassified Bartonella TaxID=2645622 RepID=UPI0021C80882|nr:MULTISPECIES: DUF2158 domain-containing protein [unclassified Bartonella]UXM95885.1 DUF2158 domain-containing protein [Bartonella sp. HY329]UXN10210.1 DUF2158 domain-containing protein [Bartonella sp. HY328]
MFKVGDIVKLKSGGPAMTAQKVDGGKATCIWFKDDRLKTAVFRKDTIELVNPVEKTDQVKADPLPVFKTPPSVAKGNVTNKKAAETKTAKPKKNAADTPSSGSKDEE